MSEHINNPEVQLANSVVGVGSVVEIHFVGDPDEETETVQIIGRHGKGGAESSIQTVSPDSPLGKLIFGKGAGDTVSFKGPTGETFEVRIISVH